MSKPKLLITRRWPKAVEEAAIEHFDNAVLHIASKDL